MPKDAKQIIRELVEETIEEMSVTGGVTGYATPNAFRGKRSKTASTERSMPGGKVVGKEDETDDTTINEKGEERLPILRKGLGEGRYNNFKKSDEMKNHAKISYGIREAKRILREVDFLVGICERLKSEGSVGSDQLWKRTKPDMMAINKQLKEIAKRVYRIGKK